jgi:hypothetical protein
LKRLISSFLIIGFLCYLAVHLTFVSIPITEVYDEGIHSSKTGKYNDIENSLFNFINRNLLRSDGSILTNIQKNKGSENTLSESVGLLMDYCALEGKKELFDRELNFLKDKMLAEDRYIKWRVGGDNADCNAAIDDLRIIRALMDAYDKWGSREYIDMAGFLQDGIYGRQVSGRNLYELYDWKADKSKRAIPLCYLDIYTLDRISDFNKGWLPVEEKAVTIISDGRINDTSPFYFKYYNYQSGGYSFDEEYKNGGGICITYTLYTALHMAEINEENSMLTEWLKSETNKGKLYAWYNPHTLKPVNKTESTAVYALAALYARKTGEGELYSRLINAMLDFMNNDSRSKYYGGFGNSNTAYFHSFDNLTALRALAAANE